MTHFVHRPVRLRQQALFLGNASFGADTAQQAHNDNPAPFQTRMTIRRGAPDLIADAAAPLFTPEETARITAFCIGLSSGIFLTLIAVAARITAMGAWS